VDKLSNGTGVTSSWHAYVKGFSPEVAEMVLKLSDVGREGQ